MQDMQFGRVAVVMGGQSREREISLRSGKAIITALLARGVDAVAIDGVASLVDGIRAGHFARVFNALHGGAGESGELQGMLDALGIPYTGSGVLGSALAMDKVRAKKVWQASGLRTPAFRVLPPGADALPLASSLGFPVMVKPPREGSSLGIARATDPSSLARAVKLARRFDHQVLLEKAIDGDELTVLIVGRTVMPSVLIRPHAGFYTFRAKYESNRTTYRCPALTGRAEHRLRALALNAFDALDCSGWGRVDLIRDSRGRCHLLEINTSPGMTSHSLTPKAAEVAGMSFADLVLVVLSQTLG